MSISSYVDPGTGEKLFPMEDSYRPKSSSLWTSEEQKNVDMKFINLIFHFFIF